MEKEIDMGSSMNAHNGEEWPYHHTDDGEMVPCANKPCRLHSDKNGRPTDIIATTIADAYEQWDRIHGDGGNGLGSIGPTAIDPSSASELCDEYVSHAEELGSRNSMVAESNLREGDPVIRLSDGSYVQERVMSREFSPDEFNRLAITENGYDSDDDMAAHWNDSEWLDAHARAAMARRLTDGGDDATDGLVRTAMPGPDAWAAATGRDRESYPALSAEESDDDMESYYARGAGELERRARRQSADLTYEAAHIDPSGPDGVEGARRMANMLARSRIGGAAMLRANPDAVRYVDRRGWMDMYAFGLRMGANGLVEQGDAMRTEDAI